MLIPFSGMLNPIRDSTKDSFNRAGLGVGLEPAIKLAMFRRQSMLRKLEHSTPILYIGCAIHESP